MSPIYTKATREEKKAMMDGCRNAKRLLLANGWDEVCSVMSDSVQGLDYGTLFIKRDEKNVVQKFYVNIETYRVVELILAPEAVA